MTDTCPKCGSEKLTKSGELFVCGSAIQGGDTLYRSDRCMLAERDRVIADLRSEVERLREALRPFAELLKGSMDKVSGGTLIAPSIKVQWIKDAKTALESRLWPDP